MNNTNNKEILEISIEDIIPNRFQPRLTFDVEALNELANSIREHGIIQPLVVRRLQDKFEIIAGERRYKAATLVGMQKVPCIVMELNDNESAEVAVIENIQRKEMTPLEEAKSFKKILDRGYLTQDELARKMGKSQSSIANKLRLLNLDEVVQDAILNNKISERHARSILKISGKEDQRKILSEILEKRLTVKQTDDLINEKYGVENMNNTNTELNNNIESSVFKSSSENSNLNNQSSFYNQNMQGINIPIANNDNNPQSNIMNGNMFIDISDQKTNIIEPEQPKQEESSSIFQYNLSNTPNLTERNQEYEKILNPSVFSNTVPNNNLNSTIDVDINSLKMNTEDINKKEDSINLQSLLTSTDEPRKNKFFVDLNVPPQTITTSNQNKNIVDQKLNEIKNLGINFSKEERDLGTMYEIVLRIQK